MSQDSFKIRRTFKVGTAEFDFFSLPALAEQGYSVAHLPYSLKILLENLLRHEDGVSVTCDQIESLLEWDPRKKSDREVAFSPARVILQDFTGVPAIVDLAVMRDAMATLGGNPDLINPLVPSELVIDHSVQVDSFGGSQSFRVNLKREFERNQERYAFLRWGQSAFNNFRVVPPGTGIVHQVNLEYLARLVFVDRGRQNDVAYPDTLVGTDSHTTMINGLGVLGWGVGGIEAEAAMLGQPISLLIPEVIGFQLSGSLPEGATATDLVLTITEILRQHGVVGKFVEFFGPGIASLSLADRATIGNMSPEYGATCAIFPIDRETIEYLRFTGREEEQLKLVEAYARAQGLFHDENSPAAIYTQVLTLDLTTVEPSIAGPKRPQDRIPLREAGQSFEETLDELLGGSSFALPRWEGEGGDEGGVAIAPEPVRALVRSVDDQGQVNEFYLQHGAVVIAAITSCTNTSNPSVMLGAGLLAEKAVSKGLQRKPWVKTSLAPGSKVVTEYLEKARLSEPLNRLGFNLVGYGCTTCIGNSGPLPPEVSEAIHQHDLVACSVLSGNRNFEGRINPDVRANYLASPPLVVAYALAGRMDIDFFNEPIGQGFDGQDVFLSDIWPSQQEIREAVRTAVKREMFTEKYADVFSGDEHWKSLPTPQGARYRWTDESTYIQKPPFFDGIEIELEPFKDIEGMRVLAKLGDSVTTDHISPAGSIPRESPAGKYLIDRGVEPRDFNSYGSRRGNHEVMMRGTFGNIRLRNELVPGMEGGFTRHPSTGEPLSIYDAAMLYQQEQVPLIVIAGQEYGSGSSRDWAAKGTRLLGVRVVLAESFERIHRSNLIGMGVLPLQFVSGQGRQSLGLTGEESYDLLGLGGGLDVGKVFTIRVNGPDGSTFQFDARARVDTPNEVEYYRHGGILHYVLRSLASSES